MDFRFGLGKRAENRHRALLDGVRKRRSATDDFADVAEMALGLRRTHFDVELERRDSAEHPAPRAHAIAVKRQRGERRAQFFEAGAGVKHRAGDHVAAEP